MNGNNEFLNVQELKPGMIITKDIVKNGNLLIREGAIVNDEIISRLNKAYFLEKIEVNISEEVIAKSTKEAELQKVEETFREISTGLKEMFTKLDKTKENKVNDLRSFSEKIQKELKSTEIIISTVVFKGSGEDPIYRHGVNVATLSALLGKWVGLEQSKINLLIYSALLHDFGMTKLEQKVPEKPDILLQEKYKIVKQHTKIGYKYVDNIPYLDKSVSYGVLMHHEREDGSGYPLGITGEKIHCFAKIIAIADELDVMNSDETYKNERGPFEILEIIKEKSLNKLDYEYSKVFLEHIANYYMGENVLLSNGEKAKILQINTNDLSRPLILKDGDFMDLSKNKDIYIKELILN
ncbi:cyclic di-GMP phosphodiesterase response regulator RpfG [Clostridium puniceum]|uniref:Cyclic di-GMP phosphodiesterase response regulator RpfG n=1 Tax=Clostridium puniceum TaxID=29367 RepID=A0A1S8TLZ7_9CLOT|nr:HD-GYP domain-containing protein [Clostridium puniceum]OOM78797.1 cyclic di-GMP phosphodiesterase response regulator RpfG [Clostridium puniceum]